MLQAPIPEGDAERVGRLRELQLLDTEPEERFDRITRVASKLLGVPIVAVSLIDENRQWFKSIQGLDVRETARDVSFCGHAICADGDTFVIPDARQDPRFADNPLVTGAPDIRFYAGGSVHTTDGHAVGALCIIDTVPRQLDDEQLALLRDLADMVQAEIRAEEVGGLRRQIREREAAERQAAEQERRIRALYEVAASPNPDRMVQLQQTLQLGCEVLGLDIGIVSRIDGDTYTVIAAHPADSLAPGTEFVLGETYCSETVRAAGPVACERAGESPIYASHPCYEKFGLQAYIGVPLTVAGQPFGTLNFSSAAPRSEAFRQADTDYVHLMAQWVSALLDRKRILDELDAARRAAEAANRSKSEFLANMSHEIRTPMNAILGMTELALETELTAQQREHLESVDASAQLLLGLLNDILDFSKIEAGKLDMESAPFDLGTVLRSTMDTLELKAREKGLQTSCEIAADVPTALVGDAARLRQVLINLVSNAIKFTTRGEVAVRVESVETTDARCALQVSVRDTGTGIAPERQEAIFEAFIQEDGSVSRQYGGTGLGLSISSRLVELMGGRIWLESQVGKGSTFAFTVDLERQAANAADAAADAAAPGTPAPPTREAADSRPLRILLAEDNTLNQRLAVARLKKWGCRVDVVDNGLLAVEALEGGAYYDVVLMDVQMPVMDGVEATRRIRDREASEMGRRQPIVALTAHAMKGDRERFLEAGMDGYASKPLRPDDLRDAIDSAIEAARARS